VIATEPVDFEWPDGFNFDEPVWLVFGSAVGVKVFFSRLSDLHKSITTSTKIAVIGEKTAMAVAEYGYRVDFVPSEAYGKTLFRELRNRMLQKETAVLYARPEKVNFDPAELLAEHEVRYFPIICYRTVDSSLDEKIVRQLTADDSILFTAPSAVRSYQQQFGKPLPRIVAIGRVTAKEMTRRGWSDISTLPRADIDSVLEFV
jgi:uroporphyrinogen-III synthase